MSSFPDISRPLSLSAVPLLALLALTNAAPVCAQESTLVPSLSLRQEFNDNVDAVVSNRRSDHITTVSPALSASLGTETAKGAVAGGVNALYYLQETRGDSVGYFVKGDGNYSATPRLSFVTDIGFTKDSRASSIDPETSLAIGSRTSRLACRAGGTYRLSEAASASAELKYGRDDYDSTLYLDSSYYQGSAGLTYDLERYLPAATLAPLLSFRQDRTSVSQVDDINATIGFSGKLGELWALSASGGVRFTRSEFDAPGGGRATNDDVGGVGKFSLSYAGESTSGSLALSHALTSASGRTGTTQLTGGTCSIFERFTSTLSGSVSAGYAWNRSAEKQFAAQAVDERSRNVSGSLFYRILEAPRNLALEARYSHHTTQYRHTGTEMNQNVVMLQLNWQHDMLR